ncbi:MAG TPA: S9 family peptidase [Povalibacter sp.]|nr:S9 family peptidase [Povalibacter sp.]
MRRIVASVGFALCMIVWSVVASSAEPARRLLTPDDVNALHEVGDPQLSADGEWVAYTVRTSDLEKDQRTTHVWMTNWSGTRTVQLTNSKDSEDTPRWSPDGQYLAFLSARSGEDEPEQLWLMDRNGGEAQVVTAFKGDVLDYEWSPDSRRIALIVMDQDPAAASALKDKTPPPIVIDRYYFKEDETGYLGALRRHLYVLDVATRKAEVLTPGKFDETFPTWSPDGSQIAFVSKRGPDPDRSNDNGLYVIAPQPGSEPRLVTIFHGDAGDSGWMTTPSWRPDGKVLALTVARDPKLIYYAKQDLMIANADGSGTRIVTGDLDRNFLAPRWSADGKWIYGFIEDDRNQQLARINPATGKLDRILEGRRESTAFDIGTKNRVALLDSTVDRPDEVLAVEGGKSRQLTHHNDAWLSTVRLAPVTEISATSKDGTRISGFLVTPPDYVAGKKYPTVLQIHGGPVSQFANSFMTTWQILASQGYVVIASNPRGSSGRGEAFAKAIWAEWGVKDTEDVLAIVDYAVTQGIADPERLGVGGWSYGGILTNFVISKDTRFKAATSGASMGNALAGYGTDMYVREYEAELGTPWNNLDVYLHNAYPLLHADKIRTPTLFLCGDKDFNVPLLNSEQMYQALRSTGVDSQLIIYPGQYHGLRKPSYLRDRVQRYVGWFGKYLQD